MKIQWCEVHESPLWVDRILEEADGRSYNGSDSSDLCQLAAWDELEDGDCRFVEVELTINREAK